MNLKREFLINLLLLLFINLLIKPVHVLYIEASVQNELGTALYGTYFYHLNFVYLFQFIGDFGLQTWNNHFISQNRETAGSKIMTVFFIKGGLSVLWLIFVLILGFFQDSLDISLLLLITINLVLSTWFVLIRTFISGLGHYTSDSWLSVLDKFCMILTIGGLLWMTGQGRAFSLQDFILAQTFSYVLAIGTALFLLMKKIKDVTFRILPGESRKIIRQSMPFAVVLFLMMSYTRLDGFLLGLLLNDNGFEAGIYAASYRIFDAVNMFLYMVPALLLPMFSFLVAENKDVTGLTDTAFKWIFLVFGPLIAVTWPFAEEILSFIYTDNNTEKIFSFRMLVVSSVFVGFAYIFGALSMAGNKIDKLIPVFLAGLLVNFMANLIFIPEYGANGAAMVNVITQVVVFTGQFVVVRKWLFFRVKAATVVKGLVFWGILAGCALLLDYFPEISKITAISVTVIISLPLALAFRLVEWDDMYSIIQLKNRKSS